MQGGLLRGVTPEWALCSRDGNCNLRPSTSYLTYHTTSMSAISNSAECVLVLLNRCLP